MVPSPRSLSANDEPDATEEAPPSRGPWGRLLQLVPALDSLRCYSWSWFRLDLLAGLTVAAVAVPQAMAYASVAELPPQIGLYTAIVMTFVGALLDSSRQLINGPTNAISIALLSALAFVPVQDRLGAAIVLAFLIGLIQTGITLLRLGDLTRFISQSVIVGFTLGAACLLFLDQLKNLLGLPAAGGPHDHFLVRFGLMLAEIDKVHAPTLFLGLGTIVFALGLRRLSRHWTVPLPEFLLALMLMALLVGLAGLEEEGVRVIGAIPSALPAFEVPALRWGEIRSLAGSALALAILGLLEAIAMAKAIAARTRQKLDINQQCLSEGVANLTGSFFQCMPGSGSLTRSAINVQAGGVTQWSGVFSALAVAATVLLLAPYACYIPRASLAAILLISAWRLVDRHQLLHHLRTTRFDAGIVLATALSALLISVEFCILIGVFLSFVLFVPRAARVHVTELALTAERVLRERTLSDPACNRILVFSLEGELFFGAAPDLDRHLERIEARTAPSLRVVVVRLKRVRNPDAVCLDLFARFLERMKEKAVRVLFCGVRPDLARVLLSSGLMPLLGAGSVFLEVAAAPTSSTLAAVRHAYDLLGEDLCETCPRRGEREREALYYMI
jgi:SulP family sulfate permease